MNPSTAYLDVADQCVAATWDDQIYDIIQGQQVADLLAGGHQADEIRTLMRQNNSCGGPSQEAPLCG